MCTAGGGKRGGSGEWFWLISGFIRNVLHIHEHVGVHAVASLVLRAAEINTAALKNTEKKKSSKSGLQLLQVKNNFFKI